MTTSKAIQKVAVWREAADLASAIFEQSKAFGPEERDWLTEPIRHAATAAADHIAAAWKCRARPADLVEQLALAETEVAEVQSWALLAVRQHHWSHEVADPIDQRCERLLDELMSVIHHAHRWCHPVMRRAA